MNAVASHAELIEQAVTLARELQERATALQTPAERRQQAELDRMLQTPSDKATLAAWYRDKLGLEPDQEPPDSLVYRFGDTRFIVFAADDAGTARHSVASWIVDDLVAAVTELRERGVSFERYDGPALRTADGIAPTPVGKAAWFKDSEGNLLELIQLDMPAP